MIAIAVKEIKNFIDKCSPIPDNRILPVYSYIKLVCKNNRSYFIKHAGNRFVVLDVEAEFKKDITLMIETKPFFGYVKASKGEEIKISLEGNNIKLDNGYRPLTCQTIKDLYPTIPDHSKSEKFEMSTEIKESLNIAKHHTLPSSDGDAMRPWMAFVHLRKINETFYVIGTRGEITYFQGFKETLPEISLEPETITAIKDFQSFSYYSVDNYDYFEFYNTLYGFIKPETKCSPQVEKVLENFHSEKKFVVSRQPIVNFCELVMAVNTTAVAPQIKIEGNKENEITIRFNDIADNIKYDDALTVEEKTFYFDECLFNPKSILTVLKELKSEKITVMYSHRNFVITTDKENYMGAAMEQSIVVNA